MKKGVILIILLLVVSTQLFAQQPDLRDIRFGTHEQYTRLVFEFSQKVEYVLNDQSEQSKTVELIFSGVTMSYSLPGVEINDGVVKSIGVDMIAGTLTIKISIMANKSTLRSNYYIEPDRVVIDVYHTGEKQISNAEKFLNNGISHYEKREYDDAVAAIRQAIKLRPGFTDAYYYAGLIRQARNQHDMAIFNFQQALEEEDRWGEAHFHLAGIYLIKKDTSNAIKELSRFVAVGKSEEKVIQAEVMLSDLSGFPVIESPAEKPAEMKWFVYSPDKIWLYSIIGVLLSAILVLSWIVYSDKKKSVNAFSSAAEVDGTDDESERADKVEKVAKPEPQAVIEEKPAEPEPEPSNTNTRWLKTDKDTIAEVDRLMDRFSDLESSEKEIDKKISETVDKINGK